MPGDDGESPRPPMHTPIPLNVDLRIDKLAMKLADCRPDLTAEGRLFLARSLAYRARTYRAKK
jgi:hypothetical protein